MMSVEKYKAKQTPVEDSQAGKVQLQLNEHARKQLEFKFRNIHAVVKHNRPFRDYKWLNDLDREKGLDAPQTYSNWKTGTLFLENIADIENQKIHDVIQNVKFFSLAMDGSTDDATDEQETLFIKTCHKGKLSVHFLCVGEPESTCSSDLLDFVIDRLKMFHLYEQMCKFLGLGSDGASNMTGIRNGLIALLKQQFPDIVGVHCFAHQLELAIKDAIGKNKLYLKLCTLLLGLYYYYKNSPKQRKGLQKMFMVNINVHILNVRKTNLDHYMKYVIIC
jgi:hypothetical protein